MLAQTYSDWELLLVDDGSRDGGTAIAHGYAERHPSRVRYLEHAGHVNLGMSAARNLGIEQARGEALAFLDADDLWLPDKLDRQVELLRGRPEADMVWGRTAYWFSWTGNPDDKQLDKVSVFPAGLGGLVSGGPLRAVCFQGAPPSNCASLFRTDFVRRIGAWESSFKGLFEDQVFWAKACTMGTAYIDDKCVARYRMHPESSCYSALREGTYHESRKRYLEWVRAYWRDLGIDPAEGPAVRLLEQEILRYRRPWRFRGKKVASRVVAAMRWYENLSKLIIRRLLGMVAPRGREGVGGTLTADPNPISVTNCHASHLPRGLTTLTRRADGPTEIRRGSSEGELVETASAGGAKSVRAWAQDGEEFYLLDVSVDVSDESRTPEQRTIDAVRIQVRLLGKLVAPW